MVLLLLFCFVFKILGQLNVLTDMLVLCGKLLIRMGTALAGGEGRKERVWSGGEVGRSRVRTMSSQNNSLLL